MAIGDALAIYLGTATENYQPASGVEVQLTATVKNATTDAPNLYNGSTAHGFLETNSQTNVNSADSDYYPSGTIYNTAIMLTNSLYLRKLGTTERIYFGGVQTNA